MSFAFCITVYNVFCFSESVFIGRAFKAMENIPNCLLVTFLWEACFTDEDVQMFEIWLSCLSFSLGCYKSKPNEKQTNKKQNKQVW